MTRSLSGLEPEPPERVHPDGEEVFEVSYPITETDDSKQQGYTHTVEHREEFPTRLHARDAAIKARGLGLVPECRRGRWVDGRVRWEPIEMDELRQPELEVAPSVADVRDELKAKHFEQTRAPTPKPNLGER